MPLFNINLPCSQNPSEMMRSGDKLYCEGCRKNIVDFREKTNEEIVGYLKSPEGRGACGIFCSTQVTGVFTPSFSLLKFCAAVLLAFGSILFISCKHKEVIADVPKRDSVAKSTSEVRKPEVARAPTQFVGVPPADMNDDRVKHPVSDSTKKPK